MFRRCYRLFFLLVIAVSLGATMLGCSSDSSGSSSGTTTPTQQKPAQLAIGVSSTSVKSDNSDSIIVSASVLDEKNVAIKGVTVSYSATGGALSSGSVETDVDGLAKVNFSAGLNDKSNRKAIIRAAVSGLSTVEVPVQIIGTAITLTSAETTTLTIGGNNTDQLHIFVKDAAGVAVFNTSVSISVSDASTGNVTLSASTGKTDVNGELVIGITGLTPGKATVDIVAAGALAAQDYLIQSAVNAFAIISPAEDPASLSTDRALSIVVDAPNPGISNTVVLATTLGTLTSGGISGSALNVPVIGGKASASFSSTEAGIATIQVSNFDDPSVTDSLTVAVFAPASQAGKIALQASNSVVATSSTSIKNSVNLYAYVVNSADQVVGGAPVLFTLVNATGGGETISPAIAYTNESGVATSVFSSGSLSSDAEGVRVTASVMGAATEISSSIAIVIGGTAGSVVIGSATKAEAVNNDTAYKLALSVVVSDSNGNPVPGAKVSLNLWPRRYRQANAVSEPLDPLKIFFNEDANKNLRLDPGEDNNNDGQMTPLPAVAGTIPATITVDETGVGTFFITYLKDYASYVEVELTATTIVLGSSYSSTFKWWLEYLVEDEEFLGPSPFNEN
jgi:hypothetical protein